MRVVVLGSTGMVGGYVSRLLGRSYDVRTPGREDVDAMTAKRNSIPFFLRGADYVVNCIGVFGEDSEKMVRVNAVFPLELQAACLQVGCRLIQVSTDGVFSGGRRRRYVESDYPTAETLYGMSKALGEPAGAMVLRTSLVGLGGRHSLLDEVSSSGSFVGFRNHVWNGITTLEFARCCGKIIEDDLFESGPFHLFSEAMTKAELVRTFVNEANLGTEIISGDASVPVWRELSTARSLNSKMEIKTVRKQVREMIEEYKER